MREYVIIGNGASAAGCIEGIRSIDPVSPITIVSAENHAVYCRPLVSYYLEGKTDPARMQYRSEDFYDRMKCRVFYGRTAVRIDSDQHEVLLDNGQILTYTSLCVAAGSSPFVPPIEGLETVKSRFSFMTLDDAFALEKAVRKTSQVLIVGAGLIGLKCAEGILHRAAQITVCDLADRVLSSILDSDCAAMVQKHLEDAGIRFLLGDSAVRFQKNEALMKSGIMVPFDILVLAVGVRANTSLVKDAGGAVNRGILIDTQMRTSLPDIYAAGDCTESDDISSGKKKVLAILPNAVMQGNTAGTNMAGGNAVFDKGIPMNSIGFFGQHIMSAGTYEGEIYEERTENSLKRLFIKDDRLKGFILIGREERAGIYTSLIREGVPLSTLDFESMKKVASTTAFSSEIRRKKFGGVV